MDGARYTNLLLRVGVTFAFLYPPYAALSDPVSWFAYFPQFIRALPIDSLVLLHGFGAVETVLALWILSGWRIRIPAMLMTLVLLGIVVFNWAGLDIIFRDLSIAAMTLALALMPEQEKAATPVSSPIPNEN